MPKSTQLYVDAPKASYYEGGAHKGAPFLLRWLHQWVLKRRPADEAKWEPRAHNQCNVKAPRRAAFARKQIVLAVLSELPQGPGRGARGLRIFRLPEHLGPLL